MSRPVDTTVVKMRFLMMELSISSSRYSTSYLGFGLWPLE